MWRVMPACDHAPNRVYELGDLPSDELVNLVLLFVQLLHELGLAAAFYDLL